MTAPFPNAYLMFVRNSCAPEGETVVNDFHCLFWDCALRPECRGDYSGLYCEYAPGKIAALRHIIDLCNARIAALEAGEAPHDA